MRDPVKPPIGDPCNGCGLCCRVSVCSAGSFALGLVEQYGERAPGPCPALVRDGDRWSCGVMLRPRDWLSARGNAAELRRDFGVLIGAGAGCDEAGDEPDAAAAPKLAAIGETYLARVGRDRLVRAVSNLFGGRK